MNCIRLPSNVDIRREQTPGDFSRVHRSLRCLKINLESGANGHLLNLLLSMINQTVELIRLIKSCVYPNSY